jgi:hypothetical protein
MPRGAKGAKPAKAKVEAKLPVARKSRKNEGSRNRQLEKRLADALKREAEALEQQTATAELHLLTGTRDRRCSCLISSTVFGTARR